MARCFLPGTPRSRIQQAETARTASLKEVEGGGNRAYSKLEMAQEAARRSLAYNASFICTDVKIGDTAPFYKSVEKGRAPRRRGPAKILDIDGTEVTAKFQSQTFKVARYCVRAKVEGADADDEESDPLHVRMGAVGSVPSGQHAQRDMGDVMHVGDVQGNWTSTTGSPKSEDRYHPVGSPAPECPASSERLPSPPRPPASHPEWESSLEKMCEPCQAPVVDWAHFDHLTWGRHHEQCSQRGYRRGESKEALKTRLASMDAAEAGRKPKGSVEQGAPIHVDGKRGRAPGVGVRDSDIPAQSSGTTQLGGERERATAQVVKGPDFPAQLLGKIPLDGERGRAPANGVKDLDIPAQSPGKIHGGDWI